MFFGSSEKVRTKLIPVPVTLAHRDGFIFHHVRVSEQQ